MLSHLLPDPPLTNYFLEKLIEKNPLPRSGVPPIYFPKVRAIIYLYTSSSRASRGRKFQKKKVVYSKERICLYRMRARRPTSAMRKPFLCCERAFCCSMVVMCRGGDLTCFDVMRSVAGSDEAIWLFVR